MTHPEVTAEMFARCDTCDKLVLLRLDDTRLRTGPDGRRIITVNATLARAGMRLHLSRCNG